MFSLKATGIVKQLATRRRAFVLGPVTMEVRPGQLTLITGGNGSGKSTLLACLGKVLAPDEGEVVWADGIGEKEVLLLNQDYRSLCLPWFTVRQNMEVWWLRGSRNEALAEDATAVSECIPPLLGSKLDSPAYALSGGESQAMVLSRMLLSNRRVLLLDEPFSSLDAESTLFFARILRRRCEESGHSYVVVAHAPPADLFRTASFEMVGGRIKRREE